MITANNNNATASNAGSNPYDMSSGLLNNASDMLTNISEGGILQNVNDYLNPYYDSVVNSTLDRMAIDRDTQLGNIAHAANSAGAFGGSRHGIVEGQLLGDYNRNVGEVTGNLMARGFDNASTAARQDMFNAISGMTGLGQQYYGIGNDITDRQAGYGGQQQQLWQQLLSGGEGAFQNMVNSPYQMIDLFSALLSGDPRNNAGKATASSTPGLFDYLSLAAGLGSAFLGRPA